ncbi:Pentatricopeptide repeat-containing [Hyphodiscus hymeniophilus]|uniref:Pentatricopeptide repeat-containing n=1 Tax=Hyphodiscus hymeniophilus TaxID=353542 RepID=A0A9P6VJP0_9HELO|nr:Pentatricopeptide repeat-containing [Hyphodiscus hymeniophilus]
MLERTAGCLESGSLRRLFPGSTKALKSRRELHSGFWTHGAIELELSPLWAALIRGPDTPDQRCESEHRSSIVQAGMLLDFLYPGGTIRFLRQYSGWGFDKQDGRRSVAGLAKLGHRLYTSSAKDPSLEVNEDAQDDDNKEGSAEYLQKFLGVKRRSDYEEAWRRYSLLKSSRQQGLRSHLIQFLATSNRVVDAERTTGLFKELCQARQQQPEFIATIRAYLRLNDIATAVTLNRESLKKFGYPVGADRLLAYTFGKSLWPHAFEIWSEFRNFQNPSLAVPSDIFELVYHLPSRVGQTYDLANYVAGKILSSPKTSDINLPELLDFASEIVKHLLLTELPSEQPVQDRLLGFLRRWGRDSHDIYETCLQRLLQGSNNPNSIIRFYRRARRVKEVKLSRWILHGVLSIFCDQHSVLGMQQILDDFFRWHERPSRRTYQLCMREFAFQGDAGTVHALFDQYVKRFHADGRLELSGDEFAPLLHVHATRGELAIAEQIFEDIHKLHNLQPTILCWNILLNAYGKVGDIDGAFQCFEHLLEMTSLQPDGYTFGTLMGICATNGDRGRAVEVYKLSESRIVERSTTMVDSLVLTYLKDEFFSEAEKLCEDSVNLKLKGSRTRMWNYLLVAYANRRDLHNVNRLLRRMVEVKIDYDQFTYSALMQALCMVKQPDRARDIMTQVMREAGIKPTNVHYAVLMGGYMANKEHNKVFQVQREMQKRDIEQSASTRLLTLKAAAAEDQKILPSGTEEQQSQRALQIFQDTLSAMDPSEVSKSVSKGFGKLPRDIALPTAINSFVMFVLGQRDELESVSAVYEEYLKTLPENRRDSPPIQILSALMMSKQRARDFVGTQECWDLAFSQAKAHGRNPRAHRFVSDHAVDNQKILTDHQLSLNELITTQMICLSMQSKTDEIPTLVNSLLEEGFLLDNKNWNFYIQILARRYRYQLAFQICEERLMPNWTGWARIRWQAPERNRLPIELRNVRKLPKHYRPKSHTLLYLAKGYLELQSAAAESTAGQNILAELEGSCPKTINAIRTMQRVDDSLERDVLRDFVVGWS